MKSIILLDWLKTLNKVRFHTNKEKWINTTSDNQMNCCGVVIRSHPNTSFLFTIIYNDNIVKSAAKFILIKYTMNWTLIHRQQLSHVILMKQGWPVNNDGKNNNRSPTNTTNQSEYRSEVTSSPIVRIFITSNAFGTVVQVGLWIHLHTNCRQLSWAIFLFLNWPVLSYVDLRECEEQQRQAFAVNWLFIVL